MEGVSFNVIFGSDEYPEFVGSYNDVFVAMLDGVNISFDENNQPISVNNDFFLINNDTSGGGGTGTYAFRG